MPELFSAAFRSLKELVEFKSLTVLWIGGPNLTDTGAQELAKLTHLNQLGFGKTKITDAGLEDLKKSLPGTKINR